MANRPRSSLSLFTGLVVTLAAAAASSCFDSDDKFRPNAGTTTGESSSTTTTTTTTSTTEPETTGGPAILTCQDAIRCLQDMCVFELLNNPVPEPDFSCVTECVEQEGLTRRETKAVLDLANCSRTACVGDGACEGASDTDGTGGDATTSGGPPPPVGPIDPCLFCLFDRMTDPGKPGCEAEHAACN